jgi:hypothetical protein
VVPPTCGSVQGAIDIKMPTGDVCTATFSLGNAGLTNTSAAKSTATTTKQRVSGCNGGWGTGKARKLQTFGFDADTNKPSFTISCPGTGYSAQAVSFDNFVIPNDNTGRFWFKGTCQDSQNSNNYYTFEVRDNSYQLIHASFSKLIQRCRICPSAPCCSPCCCCLNRSMARTAHTATRTMPAASSLACPMALVASSR